MNSAYLAISLLLVFASVSLLVRFGAEAFLAWLGRELAYYDRVLNQQLLLHVNPKLALASAAGTIGLCALIGYLAMDSLFVAALAGAGGAFIPSLVVRHLASRRSNRLERQLVDGVMTIASGVRAGLTLVQSLELLVKNHVGPIRQEFAQMLREYQMGMDLNAAMHNTANRIGSPNYRLLFTAIEMHRRRGGDMGESLDRIAESIREIQRLEGKLDAITAQGRIQARMMAMAPILILLIYYAIDPDGVTLLFSTAYGRVVLLFAAVLIVVGFLWIRRIMSVDI